jgi:hypothetical protein
MRSDQDEDSDVRAAFSKPRKQDHDDDDDDDDDDGPDHSSDMDENAEEIFVCATSFVADTLLFASRK